MKTSYITLSVAVAAGFLISPVEASAQDRYYYCGTSTRTGQPVWFSGIFAAPSYRYRAPHAFEDYAVDELGADPDDPPSMYCSGFDSRAAAEEDRSEMKADARRLELKVIQTTWIYNGPGDYEIVVE